MPDLKIVIAEEEFLICEGLKSLVESEPGFNLRGIATERSLLIDLIKKESPDVLIIDHTCLGFNTELVKEVKTISPSTEILAITACQVKTFYMDSMLAGVKSFLLKNCDREEIISAIQSTAKGEKFYCSKILDVIVQNGNGSANNGQVINFNNSCAGINISEREEEIIRLIAGGFSNREIADKLFLSPHTVNTHRKNIMAKLGVNNTAGIVLFAIKHEIITPDLYSSTGVGCD